jgi:FMN phosphatase YigB (HAD superfamily)
MSTERAVLFDVDGTLYHQGPLRAAMASELGVLPWLRHRPDDVPRLWRVLRTFRRMREDLRAYDGEEPLAVAQYTRTAAALGVTAALVEAAVEEWIFTRPLKYLPLVRRAGTAAALSACRAQGWRIGVFSDYPTAQKLRALALHDLVAVEVCATDEAVNAFKPDPRGFIHACRRLGVEPTRVVYVGDRPDVDAAGAAAAGLRTLIIGGDGRRIPPACAHVRSMQQLADAVARAFADEPPPGQLAVQGN